MVRAERNRKGRMRVTREMSIESLQSVLQGVLKNRDREGSIMVVVMYLAADDGDMQLVGLNAQDTNHFYSHMSMPQLLTAASNVYSHRCIVSYRRC